MAKIDYGSSQGRAYDEYLPEKRSLRDLIRSTEPIEFQAPLPPGLTADEIRQYPMPSDNMGFALALAIVSGICIGVLVLHWATKAGWV